MTTTLSDLPKDLIQALQEELAQVASEDEKRSLEHEAIEAWDTLLEMQKNYIELDTTPEHYAIRLFKAGVKLQKEIRKLEN